MRLTYKAIHKAP